MVPSISHQIIWSLGRFGCDFMQFLWQCFRQQTLMLFSLLVQSSRQANLVPKFKILSWLVAHGRGKNVWSSLKEKMSCLLIHIGAYCDEERICRLCFSALFAYLWHYELKLYREAGSSWVIPRGFWLQKNLVWAGVRGN